MQVTVSLFAGRVRTLAESGRPSGIVKSPVDFPLAIGPEGFVGDEQADRRVHGAPDKAVQLIAATWPDGVIEPPLCNSSRARYQIVGAVSPRCGSFARRLPPAADRPGIAAQEFDAPAMPGSATGENGPSAKSIGAITGATPGTRLA